MRGVARDHRPAPGLGHIADEESRPAVDAGHTGRHSLEEGNELRMAPIAVA